MIQGAHRGSILAINGQLTTAEQLRQIVLKTAHGTVLRLRDVASVIDGVSNTRSRPPTTAAPGSSSRSPRPPRPMCCRPSKASASGCRRSAVTSRPGSISGCLTDRTTTIRASVTDIEYTLLITVLLVLVVVTLFMRRVTPTIAAGVTVPLSIAGTLAAMWALGFSLDNFSLLALTISVGFVVDDAIVMIENIVSQHERGVTGVNAAVVGAKQIGFTVLSITASLVVVFLPLTLMGGIVGRLFYEFAMTLSVSIVISGLVVAHRHADDLRAFHGARRLGSSQPARAIGGMYRRRSRPMSAPWLGAGAQLADAAGVPGRDCRVHRPAVHQAAQDLHTAGGHRPADRVDR